MTPAAISTSGLTKCFGPLTAVEGLDLEVQPGEIFGFLGVNGSGKTTTIRVLLDLLRPTAGRTWIFGRDCHSDGLAARAGVGYMPSEPGFHDDMTGEAPLARHSLRRGRSLVAVAVVVFAFQLLLVLVATSFHRTQAFDRLAALVPDFLRPFLGSSALSTLSFTGIVCAGYFHPVVMGGVTKSSAGSPTSFFRALNPGVS